MLALLAATMPAMAAPSPPVTLTWSAPDDCPSGELVVARVEQLLSRAKRASDPLVAEATIAAESGGYRLDLSTQHGEQGLRRTVRAEACDELADAAALIMALWIDPALLSEQSRSEGAVEPTPRTGAIDPALVTEQNRIAEQNRREGGVEATTRTSAPAAAPQRGDSSAPPHWLVIAGPVVDFGSLPELAPGLSVGGGVEVGGFAATLSGLWFPYSQRQVVDAIAEEPAKGGTFSLLTGMVRLCYQPLERLALAGCGTGELGVWACSAIRG